MKNIDSLAHVSGESIYVDDIPEYSGTYHAVLVISDIAHGKILEIKKDINHPELIKIITHHDIPGENQIGGIIPDEELLASEKVHYAGQPIAIVVASTLSAAYEIRDLVTCNFEELEIIIDPREAYEKGEIIGEERTFSMGNPESAWDECDKIVEGRVDIGGQEHLYLETQGAYSIPTENGYKIVSSTQGPTSVQRTVSRILDIPMHKIEIDVRRLGGGFGGKEDQATPIACMAALASHIIKHPVKLILDRHDDLRITGKRHPYSADYKIGVKGNKIQVYEVKFFQNAGAAADLSPAVLERTLFHATNSYFIPNVKATAVSCRTNLPPNTAFRGFGGPQGMIVIESAIDHIAQAIGIERQLLQEINLIEDGEEFPYGQKATDVSLKQAWDMIKSKSVHVIKEISEFNKRHSHVKKGYAFMPISFGISFTNTSMNQAGALVNIYSDGSIGISTGAVEMGQGVNTRILQTVTDFFSLPPKYGKIETTNTTRVINTSPSAASSTHDLNGKATIAACEKIKQRLDDFLINTLNFENPYFADGKVKSSTGEEITWEELVSRAHLNRVDLAAHGHYATPNIYFNKEREKGHPFAYHTFGVAFISMELDYIRGTTKVDTILIAHDSGKQMNTEIDLGQVEGAVIQGLGWMLIEDLSFTRKGIISSGTLSTYKVPDINFIPNIFETTFLDVKSNKYGLKGSKAIGEPPLMYAIAAIFAVRKAMQEYKTLREGEYVVPLTNERVFLNLHGDA